MKKEEAWAAFADQYNHRLHGPSDAFKFAWDAATKAEREACADLCATFYDEMWEEYAEAGNELAEIIRARGEA